ARAGRISGWHASWDAGTAGSASGDSSLRECCTFRGPAIRARASGTRLRRTVCFDPVTGRIDWPNGELQPNNGHVVLSPAGSIDSLTRAGIWRQYFQLPSGASRGVSVTRLATVVTD